MELKSVAYWPVIPIHTGNMDAIQAKQTNFLANHFDKRCCLLLSIYMAKQSLHIFEKKYREFYPKKKLIEPRELLNYLELTVENCNVAIPISNINLIRRLREDFASFYILGHTGCSSLRSIYYAYQTKLSILQCDYAANACKACDDSMEASWPHNIKTQKKQNKLLSLFMPLENWSPSWHTNNTTNLAKFIYENKSWKLCPILADALMDAGCDDPYTLWLLKAQWKRFGRGVWLIDHLIGKR